MKLTRSEQETIIRFDEQGRNADVYTHNKKIMSRLAELQARFPSDVVLQRTRQETSPECAEYELPKAWIRINPPRKAAELSEEQKEQRRARLRAIRDRKKQKLS